MTRSIIAVVLSVGIATVASGCATNKFVREQLGATEAKIADRVDTQETKLRDMSDRTGANTQAIEAAGQQLKAFDTRLEDVSGMATDAKTSAADAKQQADSVANALRDTRGEFNQKMANRNRYSTLETISVFFDFNRADLKDQGMTSRRRSRPTRMRCWSSEASPMRAGATATTTSSRASAWTPWCATWCSVTRSSSGESTPSAWARRRGPRGTGRRRRAGASTSACSRHRADRAHRGRDCSFVTGSGDAPVR